VKLAVVVQRYGTEINGGAEMHARYIAEGLSRSAEVEVLTTCARDYVTWKNEFAPGEDRVNGLTVRRFPVTHPRDVHRFAARSAAVFDRTHSLADELAWVEEEGPTSPALIRHIRAHRDRFDYVIYFCYRYYQTYFGARETADKAILVPEAEREPTIGVSCFHPLLRGVRAIMYNCPEERDFVQAATGNRDVPHAVAGIGSTLPAAVNPDRFRRKFGIQGRFAIYVGRIDPNKGCAELFDYYQRYLKAEAEPLPLVLCGNSILPIPDSRHVRHLGFISDEDKFDGIAASDVLIMPSYYESFSIVTIEAWALGKPVLANAACDVLKGQCLRSNAGLFYQDADEFGESLNWFARHPQQARVLGENGVRYYQANYTWPMIERRWLSMIERLDREGRPAQRSPLTEPMPGWFARRHADRAPATYLLEGLPSGPSLSEGD